MSLLRVVRFRPMELRRELGTNLLTLKNVYTCIGPLAATTYTFFLRRPHPFKYQGIIHRARRRTQREPGPTSAAAPSLSPSSSMTAIKIGTNIKNNNSNNNFELYISVKSFAFCQLFLPTISTYTCSTLLLVSGALTLNEQRYCEEDIACSKCTRQRK